MEEKKTIKVSISTVLLILAIIGMGVMGYFIYKLNDEKTRATEQVSELNNQVKTLENTVSSLQKTIEEISNTNKTDTTANVTETKKEDEQSKSSTSFSTLSGLYQAEVKIDDKWTGDVSLSLQENGEFSYGNDPRTNAGVSGHYTFKDDILTLYKELSHPNDVGGPYPTSGTITLKINSDGSITDENLHERNISVTLTKK